MPFPRHLRRKRGIGFRVHQTQTVVRNFELFLAPRAPYILHRAGVTDMNSVGLTLHLMYRSKHLAPGTFDPICCFHGLLLDEIVEKSR